MDAVLQLRGVTKDFPGHRAVDDVTFEAPRGALFALVGPSGCGKTTVLRMIAGLETPTRGEVYLNGARIDHLPPYARNVSTVFQNYALFPHLTVRGNVEFGLRRRGDQALAEPVRQVLELLRLAGKESRRPSELSGGERQRVALARSLVLHPEVLLLDEPLSALDPNLRKQVRVELKALQRRVGITFLMVTHDQDEALSLSDQIAVLHRGRLEQVGPPQEIYLKPKTRFVAGFLGAVNWINGVGVRPEAMRVSAARPGNGARVEQAIVGGHVFLGNCYHVETNLANGVSVVAEVPREEFAFQTGEPVHVWWRAADELKLPADA